ncbi:hypothetical protein [Flavobacterium sp. N1994]|uniref:hypothetical protein n=1 Tax=Flavobacterium sp. N1994 TaxID=2986827 RepID=UPI002222D395|nr:hypothetical protein [Flavobacterium sp. N1994]
MKFKFILLLLVFPCVLFSQINFEKGYIIGKNNNKTECLIKNKDWLENPTEFEYKLDQNSDIIIGDLNTIKEFAIENEVKFINTEVKIDKFNNEPKNVEFNKRNPEYTNANVFLRVLIDDKYKLYEYRVYNHISFFIQDAGQYQQLIYKKYIDDDLQVVSNNLYKQQLATYLSQENLDLTVFERLNYSRFDFEKLFKKVGSKNVVTEEIKKVKYKNAFRIYLQPGFSMVSPSITARDNYGSYSFKSGSKLIFRPAVDLEYNLPFNKNKWSIFMNLSAINYSFNGTGKYLTGIYSSDIATDMSYKSMDLGLGVKHYLFLNSKSSIFIDGAYNISMSTNGKVTYSSNFQSLEATNENYFSFGLGYNYNNLIGLEAKYTSKKPFTSSYYMDADVSLISFILSYNILHKK